MHTVRILRGLGLVGVLMLSMACALLSSAPAETPQFLEEPAAPTLAAVLPTVTATVAALPLATAAETLPTAAEAPAVTASPTGAPEPSVLATESVSAEPPQIYLLAEQNLWLYQEGGDLLPLTTSGDVRALHAAPDGDWVAYLRSSGENQSSLWVMRADGSQVRELVPAAFTDSLPRPPEALALTLTSVQWVPGQRLLAFSTMPIYDGPGPGSSGDLWLVDVERGAPRQILEAGVPVAFSFAPDGRQVALVRADSISLMDIDGGNRRERVLTYPSVLTYSEWTYYPQVRWAADSRSLRVVIPPEAPLERPEDPAAIWSVAVDGSAPVQLSSLRVRQLTYPTLSPDGTKVAYLRAAGAPEANRSELHIAGADGSGDAVYLTEHLLHFDQWAPDSQQFLFSFGEPYRSYLGRVGEMPLPVSDTPNAYNVQWLDASRFLFMVRAERTAELRLGRAGTPSQLIYQSSDPMGVLNFSIGH